MINFKTFRRRWIEPAVGINSVDQKDYKKHFQMALINLEQNLIEERIPELKRSA